jgi:hypothetical protein
MPSVSSGSGERVESCWAVWNLGALGSYKFDYIRMPLPGGAEWAGLEGKINPANAFDLTLTIDQVAEVYRAMDERRAIKALLRPYDALRLIGRGGKRRKLANAIVAGMRAEFLQTTQIVVKNVAIPRRQPVVGYYFAEWYNDIIQLAPIEASLILHVLELIQLLPGPRNSVLIAAREGGGLHMVQILPDSNEQMHAPVTTLKRILAVAMKWTIAVNARTSIIPWSVALPINAAVIPTTLDRRRRRRTPPRDIERVARRAAIGIVDANNGRAPIARLTKQLLTTSPVDPHKAEIAGIRWQRSGAFKPTPLRRGTTKIPKIGGIAMNFNFGWPVHYHLNGAFPPVWRAASDTRQPPWLGVHGAHDGHKCGGR